MTAPKPALVLFAHGSRDPLWHQPMQSVAQAILATTPDALVTCAYLELSTPDLPTAVMQLVGQGATQIRILPLFLGVGKHAREDLPALVDALRTQYPQVIFTLKAAVGEDNRLIALLAHMGLEALSP
ncbi:MAG: CbiX/SirB N-terminal domain-containing protein [Rhodoferax sp.]|nr:CbiX/SirB N-terminal domain-containing protein [Rhodoferax sp.]